VPMDDINLHFTGDMHAITAANNLLSAMIDNHIHQGNELQIDLRQLSWTRVLDMNDRALRHVTVGLGSPVNGIPREDGFDITVASEIMAILCLATDIEDLKKRLANIVIGYRYDRTPVSVGDFLKSVNTSVSNFIRLEVGEGIEKKEEDFAAEVAKITGGNA